MGGDYYPFPIY